MNIYVCVCTPARARVRVGLSVYLRMCVVCV